jgi:hypothetical protein
VTVGILGILLFAAAPATAVVLAVKAARAGHRSGRIALVVAGLLLLATLLLTLLLGRIGLVVVAVVAVLVLVGVRSRNTPSPPWPDGVRCEGGPPAANCTARRTLLSSVLRSTGVSQTVAALV